MVGQVMDGEGGMRERTDEEVVLAWIDGVLNAARQTVRSVEERTAIETACAQLADIQLG